jgi:outer membrane protein OmpA-like peptidoglycan-associated protein/tetratricopeptide (TPR) repeat protein
MLKNVDNLNNKTTMNSKRTCLFILIIFFVSSLYAQEKVVIKKKEFRNTELKSGFKEAWKSIIEGDKYYDQGPGDINLARDHYLFAHQYNGYNAELNYKIGICYLLGDEKRKAINYLLRAYELKPVVSHEVLLLIGRAYHLTEEFDKAIQFYREYRSSLPATEDIVSISEKIDHLIIQCNHGKELVKNPKRVIIQNLGEEVNSQYDEYNARFAFNDTALFFTSRRPVDKKSKRSEPDNKYPENIFASSFVDGNFGEAYPLDKPFRIKGNSSLVGIAPDGSSTFIYVGSENGGEIQQLLYNQEKEKWKKPTSLSKYIGSDGMETTAALAPGGRELYFISSNPELTYGGKDIFVSRMNAKGKWDEPRNLGSLINTKYDEEGVFLTFDGETMYFSSKGHSSMGGFDIFKSELGDDGTWGKPQNLGYPVNTPDDEVFYVTDSDNVYGYYATIREGGYGGRDIYKVIYLGSEKEVSTLTRDHLIAGYYFPERNPFLTLPQLISIDTALILSGQVRDTIGGADTVVLAALSFMDPATGEFVAKTMTGPDGFYRTRLPAPQVYGVEINATGYLYYLDILDLSSLNSDEPAERNFFLQKIEVGTKVVLDNIYFETGKSVLTVDSYEALDQVVRFLENNESVRLEISGHTDNTGSLRINSTLSEARARAVVNYLTDRGIAGNRLEYKGYADSQPVAENNTPEGREMNRRVEFKVLSK